MGTTSEKLTYLNTTKEKIRDSINLTGANIGTSDTFRSYASKLKKGYIDIINNGIDTLYNNFPKVSGIGSNLSLTPTYEAPMKLNEIQGDTLQDGTPTPDTPVEIQSVTGLQNVEVCGKNLLDLSKCINGYINSSGGIGESNYDLLSDYIKVESGKNYTISLNTQFYNIGYAFYDSSKTYILRYNTNRNLTTLTTTIPSGTSYIRIWFNYNGTTTLTPANILQYEPMVENNSTATEYEPYKGNTYEINLGKNIWSVGNKNVNWATNYSDVKNILNTLSEGTYSITLNFKVTEIVKERTDNQYGFAFYNSNGNIFNRKNTNSNINVDDIFTNVYTFTISKSQVGNFTHAYFYGFGNGTDNVTAKSLMYDCQLEKGSQATSYSEYFEPIELNKIGTYQDRIYKDNGKWYVEKQIGKVVLDGTEDWTLNNNYTNNSRFTNNDDILNKSERNVLSNYFVKGTGGTDTTNIDVNGVRGKIMLTIPNSIATSVSNLTTWLSTHNTEVLYVLATPTYTEITNEELIEDLETLYTAKSQEGTTNISITSEDLEMILNVSALKGDVE